MRGMVGDTRSPALAELARRQPLDTRAVEQFVEQHDVPIIEDSRCTFLWRGEADEVRVVHWVFGLPSPLPLRRLGDTDLWHAVVDLPEGSRVEYRIEVVRDGHVENIEDPLNPRVAHNPIGSNSVCHAAGYEVPDWTQPDPEARPGVMQELVVDSTIEFAMHHVARRRRRDPRGEPDERRGPQAHRREPRDQLHELRAARHRARRARHEYALESGRGCR
jgi:hypothetical protein